MKAVLASQSAASRLLSNVTVARAAFVKPNGTCTPLPKAIWLPAENVEMPVAIVAFVMSTVTLTSRDSPGFSVNDAGLTVTFCPVFVGTVADRVAAAVPRFVRCTVFVDDHDACDGESRPNDAGLTVTFCPVFVGTVADRVAAAVPRFVRCTVFVDDHDACDGESRPNDSTGGSATTPTPAALS